jgi:hypothetical protein
MRFYTSTNINKMKNHLSPQHNEHKTGPQHIPFGNPFHIIEKGHIFGGLNRLMGFTPSRPDNNWISNGCPDLLPGTNKRDTIITA